MKKVSMPKGMPAGMKMPGAKTKGGKSLMKSNKGGPRAKAIEDEYGDLPIK